MAQPRVKMKIKERECLELHTQLGMGKNYVQPRVDARTLWWRIFSSWRERDPLRRDNLHMVRDGVQSKRAHSYS